MRAGDGVARLRQRASYLVAELLHISAQAAALEGAKMFREAWRRQIRELVPILLDRRRRISARFQQRDVCLLQALAVAIDGDGWFAQLRPYTLAHVVQHLRQS